MGTLIVVGVMTVSVIAAIFSVLVVVSVIDWFVEKVMGG